MLKKFYAQTFESTVKIMFVIGLKCDVMLCPIVLYSARSVDYSY